MNYQNKQFHIFWGGADVHPSFYNRKPSKMLGGTDAVRDKKEIDLAKELIKNKIPCIGICRGAQLLNVVNGGILVQHLIDHPYGHNILKTYDGKEVHSNSSHHQMMVPKGEYELLAWEDHERACHDPDNDMITVVPRVNEVIWFPNTKCLCIQPHPEWLPSEHEFVKWLDKVIKDKLNLVIDWKTEHYGQDY